MFEDKRTKRSASTFDDEPDFNTSDYNDFTTGDLKIIRRLSISGPNVDKKYEEEEYSRNAYLRNQKRSPPKYLNETESRSHYDYYREDKFSPDAQYPLYNQPSYSHQSYPEYTPYDLDEYYSDRYSDDKYVMNEYAKSRNPYDDNKQENYKHNIAAMDSHDYYMPYQKDSTTFHDLENRNNTGTNASYMDYRDESNNYTHQHCSQDIYSTHRSPSRYSNKFEPSHGSSVTRQELSSRRQYRNPENYKSTENGFESIIKLRKDKGHDSLELNNRKSFTSRKKSKNQLNLNACNVCRTEETTLWRRINGKKVCNACGLYFKMHGITRPKYLNKRKMVKRPRRNAKKSE